jgi:hypothetical protein
MKFNFFDRLNLKINTNNHKGYEKYFNNEYLRITNETALNSESPTITVSIVNGLPEEKTGDIKRLARYKKLFSYEYLIRDIETNKVSIYFKTHFIDRIYMNAIGVFLQAQVLEPVMYLKLLENDVLFMHAGGVATEKNGFLLPAYGGTGKTTFSISLLNHGFKLLGDDLLFVDTERRIVHPYPRPLHLFTYNINNLNGAKVPSKYKVAIYAKNILRFILEKLLHTEFLISTRVHADEIFDRNPFAKTVKYKGVFFLVKKGSATRKIAITEQNAGNIALEIMNSADLNDSLYEIIRDNNKIKSIKKLEQKLTKRLLLQFESLTYVNTRKLNLSNLKPFIKKHFEVNT